ncbi:MAG TPA: ABC transporter permease [Ktedonobacteraceae bacterium]|nr:ABC transporter permease [Ktedonobacteraceae bacterium]
MSKKTVTQPEAARDLSEQGQTPAAVSAGGAAAQQNGRNILLIIGREYKNHITQRSFLISTILILILVAIGACVPTIVQFFSVRTSSPTRIAVINNAGAIAGLSQAALDSYIRSALNGTDTTSHAPYAITSQTQASPESLQTQVKNGRLDILLALTRSPQGNLQFTYYTHADPSNDGNLSTIQTLAQQLNFLDSARRLGLTPSQTSSLVAPPAFSVVGTQQNQNARSGSQIVAGYVLGYLGNILIYMAVTLYGMSVAMGVAEEKGSRVMEILVNAATPFQLLAGKIIGIGAAGLTQMACIVLVGIGAILLQTPLQVALLGASNTGFLAIFTGLSIQFLLLLLLYFILGFLLYSTLFAALGALVKRQDEVRSAVQIPIILLVGGYVVSIIGITAPDATWMKVLSYFPFWTPMIVLTRIGVGTVAWWEVALTTGLMIVAVVVCTFISARIYRLGVLMYGQRPGLGQLLKLTRAN